MQKELGEKALMTKKQILAQGLILMQEKGFHAATIRDICEAAEVSVGTFYSYFRNKGELFRYSFQGRDASFANFLDESLSEGTADQKIKGFVKYYAWLNMGTGKEELERIFLNPKEHWYPGNNELYDLLYKIIIEGQKNQELRQDLDASLIVDIFRVFLRGCIYEWIMGGCSYDLENYMDLYVGQLIRSFLL